jgi:hypothetical protein
MATTITREQVLSDRVITVKIFLASKDAGDDALIKKFGDIKINPSGEFGDPNDAAYPQFRVDAGEAVLFFTVGEVKAVFANDTLTILDLQKRADLWGDKIQLDIQNAMTALRAFTDTTTSTTTITI